MEPHPGGAYRLSYPGWLKDKLREWGRRAAALGVVQRYTAALRVITDRLTAAPLEWGDPQYRLPALGLLVCHGAHDSLHVAYAVDEANRIVYLTNIRLLSGHPLAQGPPGGDGPTS